MRKGVAAGMFTGSKSNTITKRANLFFEETALLAVAPLPLVVGGASGSLG